jgi:hypothetical protein
MTLKELKLCHAILEVLHELDGHQIHELPLHAETNLRYTATASEFSSALALCDRKKWVTGLQSKSQGVLWNINEAGEAALIELS